MNEDTRAALARYEQARAELEERLREHAEAWSTQLLVWRPIETAPRDGTIVLLGRAGLGTVALAWWCVCSDRWLCAWSGSSVGDRMTHWIPVTAAIEALRGMD